MEVFEFGVRGDRADEVPEAVCERLVETESGEVERYAGEGFAVAVVEKFYYRTSSNQQATVIMETTADDACTVTILVGGGGSGIFEKDLGAEANHLNAIFDTVENVCEEMGLTLVPV